MTDKPKSSTWKHSMWIFWTFTFVLNWVAFLYIGARAKRPTWWLAGAVYATPVVLLFVLSGNAQMVDALAVLLLGLVSIVHAFLARGSYIQHVNAELEQKLRKYQSLQELIEQDQEVATTKSSTAQHSNAANSDASKAVSTDNSETAGTPTPVIELSAEDPESSAETPESAVTTPSESELIATPPPLPRTMTQRVDAFVLEDAEDTGRRGTQVLHSSLQIVNLNTASAEEIGGLPGIGLLLGMTAVSIRETQGHFTSLEQFVDVIGLKPHVADRIRPYITL